MILKGSELKTGELMPFQAYMRAQLQSIGCRFTAFRFAMIRCTNPCIAEWSLKRRSISHGKVAWAGLVFALESEA